MPNDEEDDDYKDVYLTQRKSMYSWTKSQDSAKVVLDALKELRAMKKELDKMQEAPKRIPRTKQVTIRMTEETFRLVSEAAVNYEGGMSELFDDMVESFFEEPDQEAAEEPKT